MKNILKLLLASIAFSGFTSCQDENNLLITQPAGSFQIITPSTGDGITLLEANPTLPGIALTWSAMSYTTQAAVTYTVQIAASNTSFANPIDLGSTTNLYNTIQSSQLNDNVLLTGANFRSFPIYPIDVRIKATSGTAGSQVSYSNTIVYRVSGYGCSSSYAFGPGIDATSWKLMACNNDIRTTTMPININNNGLFRIFTIQYDLTSARNYPYYFSNGYKIISALVTGGDVDNSIKFLGTQGNYLVKVDDNLKSISVVRRTPNLAIEPSSNWLVGAATPGGWSWDLNRETELPLVMPGIYEIPIYFNTNAPIPNFRVFIQNDGLDSSNNATTNWNAPNGRNYPWYSNNGYTIDPQLVNAMDGDQNFKYTGVAGLKIFKINTNTKVISLN